jgi:hypothetical protein
MRPHLDPPLRGEESLGSCPKMEGEVRIFHKRGGGEVRIFRKMEGDLIKD